MGTQLHLLFRPIQANGRAASYKYTEWLPSPSLQSHVACYWASEPEPSQAFTVKKGDEATDRVLPDGCTDLIFEHDLADGSYRFYYCGMFDQPFTIAYDENRPVRKFGVRFFPGGAHTLLQASVAEFTNRLVPLDLIWPWDMKEVRESLFQDASVEAWPRMMDRYLIKLLQASGPAHNDLMQNLLHRIFVSGGNVTVRELAESEAISTRQMNRKFDQWIGMGPKKFSEIVRFQAVVRGIRAKQSADWSVLALQYGYFDQAHLIRDFRRFYGETPVVAVDEYRNMSDLSNPEPARTGIMKSL